jgi:hypothetical protein
MPLDSARHYWWARNCYYEGSPRRPRRWNKAVASHSPDSPPNPNAFSRHIRNEAAMHHAERKAFVLPCRYTLAQSWAALRKAWLAFKIANANGDIQTMRDYARVIRTLQIQMGIRGTIFEDYIFDEEDERDLLVEVSRLEMPWKKQGQIALDRSPDYEAFRNNNTLDKPIQGPRNEIFVSHHAKVVEYKTSANSCPVPEYYGRAGTQEHNEGVIKENIENNEFQYYVDTSDIDDRSPDEDRLLDKDDVYPENQFISQVPDCTIHKDKGCSYQSSDYTVLYDENEKDIKRKPRACPYNPKGINQDD